MASLSAHGFTRVSLQSNRLSKTNDDLVTSSKEENVDSSTEDPAPLPKRARRQFQRKWMEKWHWVRFDETSAYCAVCKEVRGPQPAVNNWSEMVHCRPGARNKRTTCNGSEEESD